MDISAIWTLILLASFGTTAPTDAETLASEIRSEVSRALFVGHLHLVADVPYEYGGYVWDAAHDYGIDPKDLAAVLISEKSGPDRDFSLEGAQKRPYSFTWETDSEGAAGELGLFQVVPRWAGKAGYEVEDLKDPEKSAHIAAYVVKTNHESHETCQKRAYNYHTWIAHYKCARDDRDLFDGFCRFKQNKWRKLRTSLDQVESPDFPALETQYRKELEKITRRVQRDYARSERRAIKRAKREARDRVDSENAGQ